jgi:hypothetical protein
MPRPFETFFKGQEMMNQAEIQYKRNERRKHLKLRNQLIWEIQVAERAGDFELASMIRERANRVNKKLRG